MKKWSISIVLVVMQCLVYAQNIGIDISNPTQKLDVNGRVRIQKGGIAGRLYTSTGGINALTFGNVDDNTMGIATASGWELVMDVNNGRVGINTTAPTTTLDLNASLRIRNHAIAGATFTAGDASGNTSWVGPCAFRVSGTLNSANFSLGGSFLNPQKLLFYNVEYNSEGVWQPQHNQFMAPYHGVYHFSFKMRSVESDVKQDVWVMRSENGAVKTALKKSTSKFWDGSYTWGDNNISMCLDIELDAGDAVWMMAASYEGSTCDGSSDNYFFTGQLITLLQ